jgi:hypothetical protein
MADKVMAEAIVGRNRVAYSAAWRVNLRRNARWLLRLCILNPVIVSYYGYEAG